MKNKFTHEELVDILEGRLGPEEKEKLLKDAEKDEDLKGLIKSIQAEEVKPDKISKAKILDLIKTGGHTFPKPGEIWRIKGTMQDVLILSDLVDSISFKDYRVVPVTDYTSLQIDSDIITTNKNNGSEIVIHNHLVQNVLRDDLDCFTGEVSEDVVESSKLYLKKKDKPDKVKWGKKDEYFAEEWEEWADWLRFRLQPLHAKALRELEKEPEIIEISPEFREKIEKIISESSSEPEELRLAAAEIFNISDFNKNESIEIYSDENIILNLYLTKNGLELSGFCKNKSIKKLNGVKFLIGKKEFTLEKIEVKEREFTLKLELNNDNYKELFNYFRIIIEDKMVKVDRAFKLYDERKEP